MNAASFQRRLRDIANCYLAATRSCKAEIDELMAAAGKAADREPELFAAIATAEQRRIERMLDLQGIDGRGGAGDGEDE